jgi:hypothetical protein
MNRTLREPESLECGSEAQRSYRFGRAGAPHRGV